MDIVVGIDVSKDGLDVAVVPSGLIFQVPHKHVGINDLVSLEATGGFETAKVAGPSAAGLAVIVVNPAQVRAYANALGRRAKIDAIDAAVIAVYVVATRPELRPLKDAETQALSALVGRRRQIVQMIVSEENRNAWPWQRGTQEHQASAARPSGASSKASTKISTTRSANRRSGGCARAC